MCRDWLKRVTKKVTSRVTREVTKSLVISLVTFLVTSLVTILRIPGDYGKELVAVCGLLAGAAVERSRLLMIVLSFAVKACRSASVAASMLFG